jgi:hypothetical protein
MVGLDVGTSFIITAREAEGSGIQYREIRDAFFRMKATTPIAAKMMEKGLTGQKYFKDVDDSFVVVGQDAIERAIERHTATARPMFRGIISPRERDARRILKFILTEILGAPATPGEKVVFSIPAQPVDQDGEDFDTGFHEDALCNDLRDLGYAPQALNEAEAICYSELEQDDYTGICLSFGAGMVNICVMSAGEAILKFSTTRSGDWIDRMSAASTGETDSVVQVEKEHGIFSIGKEVPGNPVLSAVAAYYIRLVEYTVRTLTNELSNAATLPKFASPIPIVISGGTSRADGFVDAFRESILKQSLPFKIKEVRPAKDQLRAVARGCLIAAGI